MGTRPSKASAPAPPPPEASSRSSLRLPSEGSSCSSLPPPLETSSCSSLPQPSKASSSSSLPPPLEASSSSSLWSDLPPELACLVLRRFPSLADRVRFGSVCRHWRHAARQQAPVLPPVLPWTITPYTHKVQTITDSEVRQLCPSALGYCSCSSENWLLMIGRASRDSEIRDFLEDPLSGVTLPLPGKDNLLHPGGESYCVKKFIVCPDNLVVATVISSPNRDPLIACCRPGMSSWSTSSQAAATVGDRSRYEDIAFQDGNIYAIDQRGDLFAHEVSDGHGVGRKPTVLVSSGKLAVKRNDSRCILVSRFLVVSRDSRLLMVQWNHGCRVYHYEDSLAFEVYEADLQMSRWSRLSSIGDQVLFVSERCSKSVPVSDHDDSLYGNRIYFVDLASYGPKQCRAGATSCGMYDLGSNTYHPIASDRFIPATAWFFPHK